MKLRWVHIKNYRSCRDMRVDFGHIHALVGANNAGKSSIIRSLDFLFNPSRSKIDEEAFWNGERDKPIWVEAFFDSLAPEELANAKLMPYLRPDGGFHIARSARIEEGGDEDSSTVTDENRIVISQHFCKPMPVQDWLQGPKINGTSINEWWQNKDQLVVDGHSFVDFVGGSAKPTVTTWKSKAREFAETYLATEHFINTWNDNPQGYSGVLKGTLPHFIFVPAVKDVEEEAKATKSNPFGQLLYKILRA